MIHNAILVTQGGGSDVVYQDAKGYIWLLPNPGALYSFDSLSASGTYQQYVVSGNHFTFTGTRRAGESNFQFDKGNTPGSTSDRSSWTTPMFSIASGSAVQLKLKNVSITSDRDGCYFQFGLYRYETYDSSTRVLGFYNDSGTAITYDSGTSAQVLIESNVVSPLDATAYYFGFYTYNSSAQSMTYTIEFDVELYIDGVRYV